MPRLQTGEPRQQGISTGGLRLHGANSPRKKKQEPPPAPLGANRASRARAAAAEPLIPTVRGGALTKDRQAKLILEYKELPPKKRQGSRGLGTLAKKYGVHIKYAAALTKKLKESNKLADRKGVGGQNLRITPEVEKEMISVLEENAYDLTFVQLEEKTGIPASTACRHMKKMKGWRVSSKSCKPHLTDKHVKARLHFATKNKKNKFKCWVDIDEKWFYVYSHSGKLKLPPGVDKPRTPIKSKRFIGKVMMLIAIARPEPRHSFDGKVACLRITKDFEYSRRTEYPRGSGIYYEKGDTRRVDDTMDGDKFAEMLTEEVFPAIREKMAFAKTVTVQWDSAGGHGIASLTNKIKDELPAPSPNEPEIRLADPPQAAQSPDTNTLDLGFNNSLDSRLPKTRSFDLDAFEQQILDEWDEYPAEKLDDLFDMKSRVLEEIIKDGGGNSFKLPHRTAAEKRAR